MDEQQFIQDLVDKGFSEDQILEALDKQFGKKSIDPVKPETSVGSSNMVSEEASTAPTLEDMVSNLGDFSSESPVTNMYGFELSEEDIKSINKTDEEKAMDFALSTNPKYQELNSQLKEIQASKVLSPMAKDMQAKSIEKEIKKVKYYLGHKEASAYRALQQEEQVSPSSLLLKNTKYQNTKKALENIKTATKGDVTAITFIPEDEKIELQEDVENELIEQISKDEKKLDRYANYESTLALTGSIDSKENLITKAKSKALSNKINEVTEEFNNIDFSQMTKEEAQNKYKELNGKVFQLQTEYDFNAAESVFYNNFKMTDEYEKYLNREMEEGGFTDVAKDAQATLLQELIKVPIKSTIGTGLLLGNAVTEILEDVGIKEKTDDVYTGGDVMLDMFKKYISDANPLGVAKSEEFTFDFGDGFKAKNAAKTVAEMLPFVAGVALSRGAGSVGTVAKFGRFKLTTSRLAQMKAGARMTSIDSYFEGKEMGLSDGKAITYGFLKSTATGFANGIMPDANLFGGSVGKNAILELGKNLKSATTKAQIKAAANAFMVRPFGEVAEEEIEAGLGDLAKLAVGIKGKGELLNVESQSQLVAGTLLLTGAMSPLGLSADLKNSKRAIYKAYRENGAGIIKQMQEEKKEAQLRMDRARTPERKAKWKELNDQYDKGLEYASDLMLAINVSPESATPEELDLLREKQGLMRQKQGKDPLYTKRIDKKIKEIDNKLEQGEVAASREKIKTRVAENVNKIIDDLNASTESNVLIESFEKDEELSATDKIKNKIKDIESQAESVPSDSDIEQSDAFVVEMKDGSSQVFINSDVSKETKAITAPQHELLHVVLKNTFKKNPELANQMKNSLEGFLDEISPSISGEGGYISAVLENYKDQSVDIQSEEFLTALSDAMSKGFIDSEIISETALDKVGNAIKSVVDKVIPNRRYKFNSGKDVFSFIKDFNKSVYKGEFSNKLKNTLEQGAVTTTDTEVDAERKAMASKTVLEEINNLVPDNVTTKKDFADSRVFNEVYNATAFPGGVINNYIRSRTSSMEEAEAATDSVVDRLMSFDPQAKRADGSTVGIEGFGEFIFANTAFGKLDAKKKLFEESQRKAQETRIDESTKQIADVEQEVTAQEEVGIKEKPTINPLKFTGVSEDITLSKVPEGKPTFKTITKQYAGEVGEQAIGIPAKKITESAANLGSVNEARAIQQFFFKADNLDKFVKILPEFNIALPETQIGLETLDAPKDVKGTGLGLPKRILDYFYEDFIDPTGKLTSPKGRSKGLTSQVPVKRLKPEFRGIISKETIDKIKSDIGITPKGELNTLPKGELRSPIGQLLKGMAKTYSSLAANTLVRQEMGTSNFAKEDIARAAAGKQRVMASISPKKAAAIAKEDMLSTRVFEDFIVTTFKMSRKDARKVLNIVANAKDTEDKKAIYDRNKKLPEDIAAFSGETVIQGVTRILNDFISKNPKFNETLRISSTFGLDRSIYATQQGWANNIKVDRARLREQDQVITGNYSYTKAKLLDKKYLEQSKNADFVESEFKRFEDMIDFFKAVEVYVKENPNSFWAFQEIVRQATDSQKHFSRASFPRLVYEVDMETGQPIADIKGVEEHFTPQNLVATLLLGGVKNGYLKEAIDIAKAVSMQGFISKELDDMVNVKYKKTPPDVLLDRLEDIITGKLKLDQGLASIIRYTESDIDLNRLFYVPANKTLGEYFFGNKSVPVKVQKEMMRKLFSGDATLERMKEYGEKYEKTTAKEAEAFKSNKDKSPAVVKASKSNKQLLNNLNNYDKALRNARNNKAPVKGISVFDFDDTLATTKSMVGVTMPDGTETKIDATEFAKTGEDLLEQGATFDFSDFSKVVGGEPGPLIAKLDKAIKKFGNKDVFILTARPANSASAIYEFLKGVGYNIPLENITGLANSSPEAKAQWMVDKAAEGYNDFYFTDDAYKNVKAVQDAMRVLDVKSKERIAYKDRYDKLDKEMNDILEAKTGIAAEKEYSKARAEVVGSSQGKFKWFIPPSADDFVGLLYSTLSKGRLGDAQMAWYKKNLLDTYARAMNNISSERVSLAADYKALKKQLGIVPKNLRKKIEGEGFTKEQALRMYIWNKQDMNIPGLSKTDLADMVKLVEADANLQVFADQLIEINKGDGYPAPKEYWLSGSITTDLMDGLGGTKRAKHLEEWQQNADVIFSEKNLNKLEAVHGKAYREALENMLERMKSGKNRNYNGDSTTGRMLDWLNGSIGAIMFLNTRSAVLQTLSAVNFINFKDNNILAAGKAFANQPQYWKDFKELFNSDFLKERREGMNINVNEADIADMAKKGGAKGAISYLLQLGFTPTQIADSFAIAAGGSTFYRNRIKSYVKQGLSETEAKEKAFLDFRETAEESQQSSRPDRISKQQAGPLGRVVLAFANTPSQYARIIKKAGQDLAARRGDTVTNISKLIYYSAVQGFIFNAIQQALFAADMEDEEEMEEKTVRLANGMVDGVLRGMGVSGAVTAVVKNAGLRVYNESQKDKPKYEKVAFELTKLSPPIASKLSRINQAAREVQWNLDEMKKKGFSLDNPAWLAAGNVISATTNIPVDRAIKKVNNVKDAFDQDLEAYERVALLSGWQAWELGIEDEKDKKEKKSNSPRTYNRKSSTPNRIDRSRSMRIKR